MSSFKKLSAIYIVLSFSFFKKTPEGNSVAAYVYCPTCEKVVYAKEVIQSDINDDGEPINPTATLYCTECLSWLASTTMPGNFVGLN